MIYNITNTTFGGAVRNGDLIAVCNIIQFLRSDCDLSGVQFHMQKGSISDSDYVQKFFHYLTQVTDYFSLEPGDKTLPWKKVNIWDYRDICGDLVSIQNKQETQKKIVVFPVFDADYNVYRNWSNHVFNSIIDKYSKFNDYEKIVCLSPNVKVELNSDWKVSYDFMENIHHITTSEYFVGGDTGTSHFAWSLDRGPKLEYVISGRGLLHCLPFYLLQGKGTITKYWLNFEGSTFS